MIEKYGTGITRVQDICRDYGVKAPLFEEVTDGFQVTLYKEKLSDFDAPANAVLVNNLETDLNITETDTKKTTQKTTQKILEAIQQNPKITRSELSTATSISEDGVKWNLAQLKAHGINERVGADKSGYWKIIKQ